MSEAALLAEVEGRPRRFAQYAEYKESGMEWSREIPAHWSVAKLKDVAEVHLSNVDKKSIEGEIPVELCNYVDVYHNELITENIDFMAATASSEQVRRLSLCSGDVIITKDSESWTDIAVPALVVGEFERVLCGYHLALIRTNASRLGGPYLARAFSAIGVREQFQVAAKGITRFGIGRDTIRCAVVPVPPLNEQRAITAFLDRETARIDALVAKKERLVEILEEKRVALITRAVRRGLGSETILSTSSSVYPDIPATWELKKLRRLLSQVSRPVAVDRDAEYQEIGIRSWGKGIFHKEPVKGGLLEDKKVFRIEPGDFVLNIVFAWEGAVAVAGPQERGLVGSHRFPTFRCSDRIDADYLLMVLQTEQGRMLMEVNSPGAAGRNKTIRLKQFLEEEIPLPPIAEQREITSRVRAEEARIDALISKIRDAFAHLHELRTALVSAAVTGKIDVREEAAA